MGIVVSFYRCCRAKTWDDIMSASGKGGKIQHRKPEYFARKTKKGGVQVFLVFDRRLITKQG